MLNFQFYFSIFAEKWKAQVVGVRIQFWVWERRGLLAAPWWVMFGCYVARWLDKVSRGGVPRELQKRSVCIAEDIGTALHLCRD